VPHPKESAALRKLLSDGAEIVWSRHAEQRLRQRQVSKLDAERIIRRGSVTGLDMQASGEERWQLAGADPDGCAFTVVVVPLAPNVLVVTVIV
jgi:hypothetical protein